MQTGLDADVADGIERTIEIHPNLPVLLTMKAWACASSGREEAARTLLDQLAPDAFANVGRGLLWPACMAQLAEAIATLGMIDHAGTLYELLEPWSGQCIVVGQALDVPGAADRYLGMLAATVGRIDEADTYYGAAVELEEKDPVAAARCAHTLLVGHAPSSPAVRVTTICVRRRSSTQCLATANELGMPRLASQAAALL